MNFNYSAFGKSLCLSTLLLSGAVAAGTNVSVIHGTNYKLGKKEMTTARFEHASQWAYGSNFFFFEVFNPGNSGTAIYGEFNPELSLSKITNTPFNFGIIKDINIAGGFEFSGTGHRAVLAGGGVALDIPGFTYFNVNVYHRDDKNVRGSTYQITPYWRMPFTIGNAKFAFFGFVDIAGKEGPLRANVLAQPHLLLDVGNFWNAPDKLWAGIRYNYWKNAAGTNLTNSLPELYVSWEFA